MAVTVTLAIFVVGMAVRIPVVFALMTASTVYICFFSNAPLAVLVHRFSGSLQTFPILALPLYVLVAEIMNDSRSSEYLFDFVKKLVGHITGSVAHASVLADMIFAGISGTLTAETAGLGAIEIPQMEKQKYDKAFAAGVVGSASILGPIIPPSAPMIMIGMIAGESIGRLFMGGFIPGIMIGIGLMIVVYVISKRRGYPKEPKRAPFSEIWQSFAKAFPALMTPVIILGGMMTGIFTPTEAAVVAVIYAYALGFFVYRTLRISHIFPGLLRTCYTTALVLAIMGAASVFGWVMTMENIPNVMRDLILGLTHNPKVVLFLFIVLFLLLGCFFDIGAIILVITPMVIPIVKAYHISMIHFGVLEVVVICFGFLTPPFGVGLFILSNQTGLKVNDIVRSLIPFFIPILAVIFLIAYVPDLVLFVPNLVMGKGL
jgi:tripartite ATP-independent transporter DctM subunit